MRHRSALSRSPSRHHRSSATGGSGRTPRRSLRSPQQLVQLPLLLTALLALLVADLADALLDRLDAFLEDAHLGVRLGRLEYPHDVADDAAARARFQPQRHR